MINKIIIVLGSTNDSNGNISDIGIQRLQKGFEVYQQSKAAKFLLTGGFGPHFNTTNIPYSEYAEKFLLSLNVCKEDILELVLSKDTVEDAQMSFPVVSKYNPQCVTVVTSQFHLKRVQYIFGIVYKNIKVEYVSSFYNSTSEEMNKLEKVEKKEMNLLINTGKSSVGSILYDINNEF